MNFLPKKRSVGRLHQRLSHQRIRFAQARAKAAQAVAATPEALAAATRLADRKSGELCVRRALSAITVPLDFVAGTGRARAASYYTEPSGLRKAFSRMADHPCDPGLLGVACVVTQLGVSLASCVLGGIVGGTLGSFVRRPERGLELGMAAIETPVLVVSLVAASLLSNAAAMPSAGIKALGTGMGAAGGAAYGAVHGGHRARHFQAPAALPVAPLALPLGAQA